MRRRWGWPGAGASVPDRRHWDELLAEVEAERDRRIWISHEFASESDDATAARFAAELGPRLEVVVTLRPFAALLGSSWQQYLKAGSVHRFEDWLERVLADPPDTTVTPTFHRRNDQGGVVRRWAAAVGADHVTVVVADPGRPRLLTDAFEGLLDLPAGFLADDGLGGRDANRRLSATECELVRQLNLAIRDRGVHWADYERLVRDGAVARLLDQPPPPDDELVLPGWAVRAAAERSDRYAAEVAASGVRVVGDLDLLRTAPRTGPGTAAVPELVSAELTGAALAGVVSAALGRGAEFDGPDRPDRRRRAEAILSTVALPDIGRVLLARSTGGIRRRVRRATAGIVARGPRTRRP
ncbi:hypothetical protein FHX74_002005 [Friedmanniella endophytica]|uniref:Uncharacterized protein n=1 Tax=Microlunatus kandeliicorticis TaxID=1759536 RepID=A0A7W3P5V7_9ACTN|nr:hypothetical protein [Microlunatus kandeliicorticis]MBA8794386.1 hypothetical protein [Microlunatus kandeliicorticis]